jgi:hypothetical protein
VTASSSNNPLGLQSFAAATRAINTSDSVAPETALAPFNDPTGFERLERSRAQTPKGFRRLANAIMREAIGIPLTREQRAKKRTQQPKLDRKQIDKNAHRAPLIRQRSPREMRNRRKPGWTTCEFCLPRVSLEGLRFLAIAMAEKQHQERSCAPLGHRRLYPRTRNFYVLEALNWLFTEYDMPEFVVPESKPLSGRVQRFVAPID